MIKLIRFQGEPLVYMGRNGLSKQIGIEVTKMSTNKGIMFAPLNSKQMVGNCLMEIPIESVPELISTLKEMLGEKT